MPVTYLAINKTMFLHFRDKFPQLNVFWDKYLPFQTRLEVPTKTILLEEGKISQNYIFIEKGCVRTFFNNNGEEKTVQFFFENEGLTSFDSFVNNIPSQCAIETIEPSVIYLLPKQYVTQMIEELMHEQNFAQMMLQMFAQRQTHYINEFISFIRDTPEQRYQNLLRERPHIVQRVPQHYIASYLGVTTVHLSRIKSKIAKGKAHF
ncbi:Crp/Fnr family transcriptional regulator [Chitinophaga sp. CF418]|uniref:Crp/Fnr family transcriptional regulator n=1 Tax=Chitinophaga sp. CF418 TaxID=1855287 RepID=UPI000910D907|nr:Crp/Fnr family transcriptional regulator [Chitinophaga sp. CF418]SHM86714.1 cAMP-binding domain of CRP or a regulatory subunit of cAMP-dependent protein kinases [Chitinophaga sp. CF418]